MTTKKSIQEIIDELKERPNDIASPEAILAIQDPWERRNAIVQYVSAKRRVGGEAALTPFERVVDAAMVYEFKEAQGTLFDEAQEADRCAEAIAVLEQIGARNMAHALRAARALYEAVPKERAASARSIGDWYELAGEGALDAIRGRMVENEVADCLVDYIAQRRDALRAD